jgi:predicted transcriptional regulator
MGQVKRRKGGPISLTPVPTHALRRIGAMPTISITVEVAETALAALETWLDDIDAGVEEENEEYIDAIDKAHRAIRLAMGTEA